MTLLRWLTFLLGSLPATLTVLLFWISFFLVMLLFVLMDFPPLGNSDYVVVSVSIDFSSNSKLDTLFHCTANDYFCADMDNLSDHLRNLLWEDLFKLSASAAASEFCEWIQVGVNVYIPHLKYQVKCHLSPWFSAACAAPIGHRNHFFLFVPIE